MWLVGDNFVSTTFRTCYKKTTTQFFIRDKFEVVPFCSNKYVDKNDNVLSRLQITLATALNKKIHLPNYIVVVLDDDLIQYLKYKNFGVSTMYGTWIEWLANEFDCLVNKRKLQLPDKAKNDEHDPQFYWMALPLHQGFNEVDYNMRCKFNLCLESVMKTYSNMRIIKPKTV